MRRMMRLGSCFFGLPANVWLPLRLLAMFLWAGVAVTTIVPASALSAGAPDTPSLFLTVFEYADFVMSNDSRPPDDVAAWRPVRLPHEWSHAHPGVTGQGWYRIRFDLAQPPSASRAVNINHMRSHWFSVYVNGISIAESHDLNSGTMTFGSPLFFIISAGTFRAGANVIHVRMNAAHDSFAMHGLGRIAFGDAQAVRRISAQANQLGYEMERTFLAMAFTAGIIVFFLWFARRGDRVMLWFSIICLAWGFLGQLRIIVRWWDLPMLNSMLTMYWRYGLVLPSVILCLHIARARRAWLDGLLVLFLILEVAYPLWSNTVSGSLRTFLPLGWEIINAGLLLIAIGVALYGAKRPLRWTYWVQVTALSVMIVLIVYEIARYLGWMDVESLVFRQYHVPLVVVAIGAAVFERHILGIRHTEQMNVELEQRVAEKAREIEAYHAERAEVLRQQTLAHERQRIVTDMHDGLGASLVGLLRYAQSKHADPHIEQRVKEALQELRIAIDALEPSEGDLASILGNLRYRLEPLLGPSGIQPAWDVAELPRLEALEPTAVFAIQRIVLEAVANALKHSGAKHIYLSARPADDGGVEIRIGDDGCGFDPSQPAAGLGLSNMRVRAERIGARLDVISPVGEGTVVRLLLPRALAHATTDTDRTSEQPEPRALRGLAPVPGSA